MFLDLFLTVENTSDRSTFSCGLSEDWESKKP